MGICRNFHFPHRILLSAKRLSHVSSLVKALMMRLPRTTFNDLQSELGQMVPNGAIFQFFVAAHFPRRRRHFPYLNWARVYILRRRLLEKPNCIRRVRFSGRNPSLWQGHEHTCEIELSGQNRAKMSQQSARSAVFYSGKKRIWSHSSSDAAAALISSKSRITAPSDNDCCRQNTTPANRSPRRRRPAASTSMSVSSLTSTRPSSLARLKTRSSAVLEWPSS